MMHKKRYDDDPAITVDGLEVLPSRSVKYLGVRLDARRLYTGHIEEAAKKATQAAVAVGRLNSGGPTIKKR